MSMNYKFFFHNSAVFDFFKRKLEKLPEDKRYGFYSVIARAYQNKQLSKDDNLPTYKLTKMDVDNAFVAYA